MRRTSKTIGQYPQNLPSGLFGSLQMGQYLDFKIFAWLSLRFEIPYVSRSEFDNSVSKSVASCSS